MGFLARDVMQSEVRTVAPNVSLADLERIFCDSGQSGFPVVGEDDRLVGVVSRTDVVRRLVVEQSYAEYESSYYWETSDYVPQDAERSLDEIARQVGERLEAMKVEDVMSHSPITVTGATPLVDLARTLVERRIHRLPVVEDGRLVGILTSTDLVRLIADGRIG